jgi:hypothetical protein
VGDFHLLFFASDAGQRPASVKVSLRGACVLTVLTSPVNAIDLKTAKPLGFMVLASADNVIE